MRKVLSRTIATGGAVLLLVFGGGAAVQATSTPNGDPGILAGYRTVTADSLILWNAASGGSSVGTWTWGQCFYWSAVEGSNRYRTSTGSGSTVWVGAESQWSSAGC
ncbi:hypothetical protein [Actinosynnema sp. NPDC023587]|uniref:hypothetical protein n=1 Tax=Actinosynnema sp. NPDC023587 TaxID=3154695 RepID=UPI0033D2437C